MHRKNLITTLTLNPCYDRTIFLTEFIYGGTNRVLSVRNDISGKGINVSIVLKHLGTDTLCLGLSYRADRDALRSFLKEQNVPHDFIDLPGKLRINTKVFDEKNKTTTELNERGVQVNSDVVTPLMSKIEKYLSNTAILVLSGTVPPGVPLSFYKTIIEKCNKRGVKVVLDASADLLQEGLKGCPYLIKPNIEELQSITSYRISGKDDIVAVSRNIIKNGVRYVCVSLGKEGCILVSEKDVYSCSALDVEEKSTQGAGDSLVAGLCVALLAGVPESEYLRYATAAAAASVIRAGTQLCLREDFDLLFPKVQVIRG